MRFATVAEVAALADAIPRRFRALVLVAAYTGLRWGGAGRPAGQAGGPAAPPNHGGRAAPGGPGSARLRADQDRRCHADGDAAHSGGRGAGRAPGVYAEAGPDGLVFSAERGGPIRRSNFTRRVWIPTTRAAGVEGLRFHDLRHTAATLAVAAGASTRELMVRMGHSSSAAALRYQHVMAGRDAAIAAGLDELIQAASTRSQDPAVAGSGTRLARTGRSGRKGQRR
jgi:integrase